MGVKSLWALLTPVGRPVQLETVEGKSMAIDSSIWIYQFQATMRDKEGRGLVNAHVLGFLRRICKLLFYGIKPVFVFDGGAPALKRMTISERKKKKSGAAETHAHIAEKLLAAQLRREAVLQAQSSASGSKKGPPRGPVSIDDDTVYLEDLDASNMSLFPVKGKGKEKASPQPSKKAGWKDYDVYRLPDIDMEAAVAKATRSSAPDARLATDEELRVFIDMMRPEDLDVSSPEFRELPTEVQYEIIGDLRLKSRQTSHTRLQAMLRNSETPLDFSHAQIMNLKQRNALTQQLLETTDSIGKANVTIPVRIASERNREYVLVKNEGDEGGWVLGIRDDGTAEKPIVIDQEEQPQFDEGGESEEEMDMEEIAIPLNISTMDPDLREYQRTNAFTAAKTRQFKATHRGRLGLAASSPKKTIFRKPVSRTSSPLKPKEMPLFMPEQPEDVSLVPESIPDSDNDLEPVESDEVMVAMQASIDAQEERDLQIAIEISYRDESNAAGRHATPAPQSRPLPATLSSNDEDEDLYAEFTPSRLDTALRFANTGLSSVSQLTPPKSQPSRTTLPNATLSRTNSQQDVHKSSITDAAVASDEEDDFEEVSIYETNIKHALQSPCPAEPVPETTGTLPKAPARKNLVTDTSKTFSPSTTPETTPRSIKIPLPEGLDEHEVMTDDDGGWDQRGSPDLNDTNDTKKQHDEDWDAAQEMDVVEEQNDFARFAAQVRGRDLDAVRQEIDSEIRQLNKERKAALRDSDDVTQAMVAQIMTMLRLFGIPYITAPMEAEAQCATLVELGLVDGVITDDSDVFLFGAKRVFKNMFNQSKTVECFFLADLARELGLDRGTLIRLAYLLGSDYVLGLSGVGPVVAMELLREFPGDDGLHKFKDWWSKVQTGKDKESDTASPFRKRFKKRFKDLYLPSDWPNAAVRDAYYHPVVDDSEAPFKWGIPDLDGLRNFFLEELSWNSGKVDELLLPIIQKMNRRGHEAATNRQGTLNNFFSVSEGAGVAEPRRRDAYASKRLQALVTAHRKAQKAARNPAAADALNGDDGAGGKAGSASTSTSEVSGDREDSEAEEVEKVKPARKKRKKANADADAASADGDPAPNPSSTKRGRGRGRGRARAQTIPRQPKAKSKGKGKSKSNAPADDDADDSEEDASFNPSTSAAGGMAAPVREMTLRKRRPVPAYRAAREVRAAAAASGPGSTVGASDVDGIDGGMREESGSEGSEYRGE